jgi:hypothetical protein
MPTANLLTIKLLINSIISTQGVKFMTMDIKDFLFEYPNGKIHIHATKNIENA